MIFFLFFYTPEMSAVFERRSGLWWARLSFGEWFFRSAPRGFRFLPRKPDKSGASHLCYFCRGSFVQLSFHLSSAFFSPQAFSSSPPALAHLIVFSSVLWSLWGTVWWRPSKDYEMTVWSKNGIIVSYNKTLKWIQRAANEFDSRVSRSQVAQRGSNENAL